MKTPTTRQSINVVAFFALFTSLIAAPAAAAMPSPSGTQMPVWLPPRRASLPSTTHSTNRASTR